MMKGDVSSRGLEILRRLEGLTDKQLDALERVANQEMWALEFKNAKSRQKLKEQDPIDVDAAKIAAIMRSILQEHERKIREQKRDEFDDMIDEIAAEHKKTWVRYKKFSDFDKEEEALYKFWNDQCAILFESPTDYCDFRIRYSDRLLLPKPETIYCKHPEIVENDWPVVLIKDCAPCTRAVSKCYTYGGVNWYIAQSDWRETKTVDGKKIYIYGEKEWA